MRRPITPECRRQSSAQRLVVLLLYAYCVGLPSSRKIEKACYEDLPFRVLSGNQQPDHTRISEFRRRHLEEPLGVADTATLAALRQALKKTDQIGLIGSGNMRLEQGSEA